MSILSLFLFVLFLVVCGVVLGGINRYAKMQPGIQRLLNVFVIVVLIIITFLWVMNAFNLWSVMNIELTKPHYRH